jgi:hypothetical protein
MPRKCSVCCLEEYRMQIDVRLRAGESPTALAREFPLSADSLARHAKSHLRHEEKPADADNPFIERLQLLWDRCDEIYVSASKVGNYRGMIDALAKLVAISEALSKLQTGKAGFEGLDLAGKIAYIKKDGEIFRALFDDCIHDADAVIADHPLQTCPSCRGSGHVQLDSLSSTTPAQASITH